MDSNAIHNNLEPTLKQFKQKNEENGFYIKLEESILKEGFRNPIFLKATFDKIEVIHGGSRLWVAQKHNLVFPCIISDFDNIFPDALELKNVDDIKKYHKDVPKEIFLKRNGVRPGIKDENGNVINPHLRGRK